LSQTTCCWSGLYCFGCAGILADLLDSFPFRNSIATIPEIKEYFAAATDDVRKNGYTPGLS
jgi:hypothetical protein